MVSPGTVTVMTVDAVIVFCALKLRVSALLVALSEQTGELAEPVEMETAQAGEDGTVMSVGKYSLIAGEMPRGCEVRREKV